MVLGKELVKAGYSIREDDHTVYLDFEGKQCGRFNGNTSCEIIRMVAKDFLNDFQRNKALGTGH
jgi:hypothetical protein